MAEGKPPYSDLHPFKAMFQIKENPPKGVERPGDWSNEFNEFVARCLEVEVGRRASAEVIKRFVEGKESREVLVRMS